MRHKGGSADQAIARIAARQHGVIAVRQLLRAGLTRPGVRRRVLKGLLHPEFRSVYRVGHRAPSVEARYIAAVLACGGDAVLSGRAAAYVLRLLRGGPPPPEVTSARNRSVPGVITHRVRRLDPRETTVHQRIPITTVARTVVELAAVLCLDDLAEACHEAEVRYGNQAAPVMALLARHPNAPGAAKLREVFEGEARVTLSKLERRFLALLRAHRLPLPETNRPAGGGYVDCRWPEHRLTVELDSYRYHHSRHALEKDRRRERQARARGDGFRRYTWGDVSEQPELVVAEMRARLRGSMAL